MIVTPVLSILVTASGDVSVSGVIIDRDMISVSAPGTPGDIRISVEHQQPVFSNTSNFGRLIYVLNLNSF